MKRSGQKRQTSQEQQETAALLEILALGERETEHGKSKPGAEAIKSIRNKANGV